MVKVIILLFLVHSCFAAQKEYEQCGGGAWNGPKNCESGLQCYKKDQWYSQCLRSCPGGWECQSSGGGSSEGSSEGSSGDDGDKDSDKNDQPKPDTNNDNPSSLANTLGCTFRFGKEFKGKGLDYSGVDYIAMWVGQVENGNNNFNPNWHGDMLRIAKQLNKFPMFYGYIIAFYARRLANLQDCDVAGSNNLCTHGAKFIREHRNDIIQLYKHYASESAKIIGENSDIVWLLEPDFWQYYGNTGQVGGPLDGAYLRKLFDDIATAIKSELPNSKISWDISAWIGEDGMSRWWGFFASSPHINYIHTSGGQSRANMLNIKPNELRWDFMSQLTGKKIIADTGYGVAGGSSGHNYEYDNVDNLKQRIKDGVIAVTQANAGGEWKNTLVSIRQALPKLC